MPERPPTEVKSRAHYDMVRAAEKERLVIETPRGIIRQTAIDTLDVSTRVSNGVTLVGLGIDIEVRNDEIQNAVHDLGNFGTTIAVLGDQHVWNLTEEYGGDMTMDVAHDDTLCADYSAEWLTVKYGGWR